MPVAPKELADRVRRFVATCGQAGVKLTHQRQEVFREIARTDEHPDAQTVHRRVRRRVPAISLDTVYRTLWVLVDLGLVTTVGVHREHVCFDANTKPHHHFVCTTCGSTRDFYSPSLAALSRPGQARAFGRVTSTHVEFRGVCRPCEKKESKHRG